MLFRAKKINILFKFLKQRQNFYIDIGSKRNNRSRKPTMSSKSNKHSVAVAVAIGKNGIS